MLHLIGGGIKYKGCNVMLQLWFGWAAFGVCLQFWLLQYIVAAFEMVQKRFTGKLHEVEDCSYKEGLSRLDVEDWGE